MNVSILNLKGEYGTPSKSRFTCYSRCYFTLWPLTPTIVPSQFPWSRDVVLMTHILEPLKSVCLNVVKQSCHNKTYLQRIWKLNWQLTPMISGITQKLRQWWGMGRMVTCSCLRCTLDYLPPDIDLCGLIKLAAMAKLISFPAKITTAMLQYDKMSFTASIFDCWQSHRSPVTPTC